jgi:hypothetical protein
MLLQHGGSKHVKVTGKNDGRRYFDYVGIITEYKWPTRLPA